MPHAPQLARLDFSSTQAPLHGENPALQVNPHVPTAHVGVACAGAGQMLPQAPQLPVSVGRFTQEPLQLVVPFGHETAQAPPEQTWFTVQDEAQSPQWLLSDWRLTQTPLHSVYPALQASPQTPPLQVAVPFGGAGQATPQAPQFCVSLETFRHWPWQAA